MGEQWIPGPFLRFQMGLGTRLPTYICTLTDGYKNLFGKEIDHLWELEISPEKSQKMPNSVAVVL